MKAMLPEKPNWNRIILELNKAGYTLEKIGAAVGCSATGLATIKNSPHKQVWYSIGVGILNLHAKVVKNEINKPSRKLGQVGEKPISETALHEH